MNMLEFVAAGGTVRLLGQPLEERLTPRQLRYLFATGAFAAGKARGKSYAQGGASREQKRAGIKIAMQGAVQAHRDVKAAGFAQVKFLGKQRGEIMGPPRLAKPDIGRLKAFRGQLRALSKDMTIGKTNPMAVLGAMRSGAQHALHRPMQISQGRFSRRR